MKDIEIVFLNRVKAILVVTGIITRETTLDSNSWLTYYNDGFSPIKAVKADMEGYTLPFFKWSDVQKEFLQQSKQKP